MVDGNIIEDKEEDLGWQKRQQYVKRCKQTSSLEKMAMGICNSPP